MAFSPDGKAVLTGSDDGTARLWDAATGQPIGRPAARGSGQCGGVQPRRQDHPDRRPGPDAPALGRGDRDTPRPTLPQSGTVDAGGLQPRRQVLRRRLRQRLGTGRGTWRPGRPSAGHSRIPVAVSAAAFSPDGKTLLTGCEDGTARLWDVGNTDTPSAPLLHQAWILAVAFSPDGKTVLTGSEDGTARLWDAATGMPLGPPLLHPRQVMAVAFSPDGKTS